MSIDRPEPAKNLHLCCLSGSQWSSHTLGHTAHYWWCSWAPHSYRQQSGCFFFHTLCVVWWSPATQRGIAGRGRTYWGIGYTSPASGPTTGEGLQVRHYCYYYWITKQTCDFLPYYFSLFLRGAGLAAISLQDSTRVSERKSSVSPLGNSWPSQDGDESSHNSEILAVWVWQSKPQWTQTWRKKLLYTQNG